MPDCAVLSGMSVCIQRQSCHAPGYHVPLPRGLRGQWTRLWYDYVISTFDCTA